MIRARMLLLAIFCMLVAVFASYSRPLLKLALRRPWTQEEVASAVHLFCEPHWSQWRGTRPRWRDTPERSALDLYYGDSDLINLRFRFGETGERIGWTIWGPDGRVLKQHHSRTTDTRVSPPWLWGDRDQPAPASRDFSGAYLSEQNLTEQDFQGSNLRQVNLARSHLDRCDLRGADLSKADLERAVFEHANLRNASLCDSNCWGAYFSHANLEGVDFGGADLSAADLAEARNFTLTQLLQAAAWDLDDYENTHVSEELEAELTRRGLRRRVRNNR